MYRLQLLHGTKTPCLCKFDRYGMHFHILIPLIEENVFLVIPLTSKAEKHQLLVDMGHIEPCIDVTSDIKGFEDLSKHTIINHNKSFSMAISEILRSPGFKTISSDLDTDLLHQLFQVLCQSRHIKRGERKTIVKIYLDNE